jgi:hypothetical protein
MTVGPENLLSVFDSLTRPGVMLPQIVAGVGGSDTGQKPAMPID